MGETYVMEHGKGNCVYAHTPYDIHAISQVTSQIVAMPAGVSMRFQNEFRFLPAALARRRPTSRFSSPPSSPKFKKFEN